MINSELLSDRMAIEGVTSKELSKDIGISENTLRAIRRGEKSPTLDIVEKICERLHIRDLNVKAAIFLPGASQ